MPHREAYAEAQSAFQSKAMEVLKDTLESFAPKIALHLATALDSLGVSDRRPLSQLFFGYVFVRCSDAICSTCYVGSNV